MDIIACSDGTSLRTPLDASIVVGSNGHAGHLAGTVGVEAAYVVEARGAPRRCGGLGDIVSGVTATALHWALQVCSITAPLYHIRATSMSVPVDEMVIY